jgi:bacterial/archaeal transporter family protein
MEWYTWTLICVFFLSFIPIFTKKVLLHEHATEFLTASYILFGIFSLPLLPKSDLIMPLSTWILIYIKAILVTISLILFNKARRHMELSSVEPLRIISGVYLLILAFFILGERITLIQGFGILLVIYGAYKLEISKHGLKYNLSHNKYLWYIIIALFLGSFLPILDKVIILETNAETLVLIPNLIVALHFIIIQFVQYKGFADLKHAFTIGGVWIVLVALFKIGAEFTYMKAVAIPTALISLIIILKRLGVLISTWLGGELFHEHNLKRKMLSSIIMLIGVYMIIV